ncbi:MAG: ECF transporter S component [Suipraeoptans sp.]
MNIKYRKLTYTALFAALVCVATSVIKIPTPGTSGYVHPGDALVILSGVLLGPVGGFFAAGIGSALADLFGGYIVYVPITFVIKGLSALFAGLVFKHTVNSEKLQYPLVFIAGVINTVMVVGGYLLAESVLYSQGAALAGVVPNLIQGIAGIVLSLMLYPVLHKIPDLSFSHVKH